MKPNFSPLLIGSFPHQSASGIAELAAKSLTEFPMWVQLPNRSFHESMYVQYSQGLPFVNIDMDEKKIFFSDPESDPEQLMDFIERSESMFPDSLLSIKSISCSGSLSGSEKNIFFSSMSIFTKGSP